MSYPYDDVVLIESEDPGNPGFFHFGTGFVIGPHTVLTASHLLWNGADQSEADHVWLYPGYSQNGVPSPAGSQSPLNAALQWHNYDIGNTDGTMFKSDSQSDFAVIDTSYTFSSWFGIYLDDAGGSVHITGYPAYANGQQTDGTGTVYADSSYSVLDYGTLSTDHGNSGGPLWLFGTDGSAYAIGIVSTSGWATQITYGDWSVIQGWINSDASLWPSAPALPPTVVRAPPPAPPLSPPDFNADHQFDMLWRQSKTLELAEWQLNGEMISAGGPITSNGASVRPDASWKVAGIGDFSGDGRSDLLWRNANGVLSDWTMNGTAITSSSAITSNGAAVVPGFSWNVVGVGDFNGDSRADLLWRSADGALSDWTMSGSTITGSAAVTSNGSVVAPDSSWNVAGVGDFQGDGKADILWRNRNGSLVGWFMNGSDVASSGAIVNGGVEVRPDSSWSVVAFADFNGDHQADILWRNSSTNSLALWLMSGRSISSSTGITSNGVVASPNSAWHLVEVGDFTGDSRADMIWRYNDGTLSEWQMNGGVITQSLAPVANGIKALPDSTWDPFA